MGWQADLTEKQHTTTTSGPLHSAFPGATEFQAYKYLIAEWMIETIEWREEGIQQVARLY